MISIICPVWRPEVFDAVALPWIHQQVVDHGAELITVVGKPSIFEAHEYGRQQASHEIVVYVHDDTALVRPSDFAPQLVAAFENRPNLGVIGAYGREDGRRRLPWWESPTPWRGHYMNRKDGNPVYRHAESGRMVLQGRGRWSGFHRVWTVDGFFMAERLGIPWDTETFPGEWHGYDVDRCMQAHELGKEVMVGPWLFMHDNAGHAGYKGNQGRKEGDQAWLADLPKVNRRLAEKWGLPCAS